MVSGGFADRAGRESSKPATESWVGTFGGGPQGAERMPPLTGPGPKLTRCTFGYERRVPSGTPIDSQGAEREPIIFTLR